MLYDTFYGVFKAYFLAAGLCIQCKLSVYVCIGYINAYGIFFVLSDVAKGCIDVLLTYLTALVPAYATVLLASGKDFRHQAFTCWHLCSFM